MDELYGVKSVPNHKASRGKVLSFVLLICYLFVLFQLCLFSNSVLYEIILIHLRRFRFKDYSTELYTELLVLQVDEQFCFFTVGKPTLFF